MLPLLFIYLVAVFSSTCHADEGHVRSQVWGRTSDSLQFNISSPGTRKIFPLEPTTLAVLLFIQAVIMTAIVIFGLFFSPSVQTKPLKKSERPIQKKNLKP